MSMRLKPIILIQLLVITLFSGCSITDDQNHVLSTENAEITDFATIKAKDYTISYIGVSQEQAFHKVQMIESIYDYFKQVGLESREVALIITEYSRVEKEKKQIFVDNNGTGLDLLEDILVYNYGEYVNDGLVYGLAYKIAENVGITCAKVPFQSQENLQSMWSYLYISRANFNPVLSTVEERLMAKYASIELVNYIVDMYGFDVLNDRLSHASNESDANRVKELLDEWVLSVYPDFDISKPDNHIVFSNLSEVDQLNFRGMNNNWSLNLRNKESLSRDLFEYPSMNDSAQVFYSYIDKLWHEIQRLEEVRNFQNDKLSGAEIQIYMNAQQRVGGQYGNNGIIQLAALPAFSHEYNHYVDDDLNEKASYRGISEMRAEYYSTGNLVFEPYQESYFERIIYMEGDYYEAIGAFNPVLKFEELMNRPISYEDSLGIYCDLVALSGFTQENGFRSLYKVSKGYPYNEWQSFSKFLVESYGKEAFHSLTLYNQLPDGTEKTLDSVIEAWEGYLINSTLLPSK